MAVGESRAVLVTRRQLTLVGAVLIALVVVGMMASSEDELAAPPGAPFPSGEECRQTIERSGWEPVPENTEANHTILENVAIPPRSDYRSEANTKLFPRIDGAFGGTTDEIIEWGACKWGFQPDLVRAQAFTESRWVQSAAGDVSNDPDHCVDGDDPPCPTSFGLLQIKHLFHPASYPGSVASTAFNVDYGLALMRACYDGLVGYLPPEYQAGDLEGCLGHYFSGKWQDEAGIAYADRVMNALDRKRWRELPGG